MTDAHLRLRNAIDRMHEPWGGVHCLDFANTLEPRGGPPPLETPPDVQIRDELGNYEDLVAWDIHKGTAEFDAGVATLARADQAPDQARTVLRRAHALRDALYRVFWSIAEGERPAADDLALIMGEYADATTHAALVVDKAGTRWTWNEQSGDLARPLWPVARSAIELLTTGDHRRIKVCPGPGRPPLHCAWLFYDTTKNGSRRWCSMTDCGAVTKARLQTERRRAKRTDAPR